MEQSRQNGEKLSNRNLYMFSAGTFGRDFLYSLFSMFLLNFIIFTKQLTNEQFAAISFIIIGARIFDALNDPIMGGIVENTRTKWGKFKPWQLIGAIGTSGVIIALFTNEFQGGDFIWFLGVMYFLFSITYTMNDISYWGMLPSLAQDEHDRSRLTSISQIVAGAGGALAFTFIPILTTGNLAIGGSAVFGYKVIAVVAAVLMISFQMFTILGVKEKPLSLQPRSDKLTLGLMFKTIAKNDQLLWITLVMLIYSVGTGVVNGGLSLTYIYFEFGYIGLLTTLFSSLGGFLSAAFTLAYPWLEKKYSRTKMIYATGISIITGYVLVLLIGLFVPSGALKTFTWYAKFGAMMLANTLTGFGAGFYMIVVISIANTVEYNEYKTGKREEALIFSLRPFTAKLSSAIVQGIVTAVYIVAGVLKYTNKISSLENEAAKGIINEKIKLNSINEVIANVSRDAKNTILLFMCIIPIVFMCAALYIYKKKYKLDEKAYASIVRELEERRERAK
jgi:melibiose permease/lactose/raffinose/galactose permease